MPRTAEDTARFRNDQKTVIERINGKKQFGSGKKKKKERKTSRLLLPPPR